MLFSNYLASYIEESGLSWQKAAKLCGVDRSLLRRYAAGENFPRSVERVDQIARGLGMTEEQHCSFRELYKQKKMEKEKNSHRLEVEEILQLIEDESGNFFWGGGGGKFCSTGLEREGNISAQFGRGSDACVGLYDGAYGVYAFSDYAKYGNEYADGACDETVSATTE